MGQIGEKVVDPEGRFGGWTTQAGQSERTVGDSDFTAASVAGDVILATCARLYDDDLTKPGGGRPPRPPLPVVPKPPQPST